MALGLLDGMRDFLAGTFPRDLLIPARGTDKRPALAHRAGAYSWDDYDRIRNRLGDVGDWIVLVRDLLVLDFDVADIADAWEERFPEMRVAPMERTRKGRHYYFRRPERFGVPDDLEAMTDEAFEADKGKWVFKCDGLLPKVDLLTVTGSRLRGADGRVHLTSGTCVVAPSTNKTWARRPWDVAPGAMTMSDALVTYLSELYAAKRGPKTAAPKSTPSTTAVEFEELVPLLVNKGFVDPVLQRRADEAGMCFDAKNHESLCPACGVRIHESNNFIVTIDARGRHWVRNWSRNCRAICVDPMRGVEATYDLRPDFEFGHVLMAHGVDRDIIRLDDNNYLVFDDARGLWEQANRNGAAHVMRKAVDMGRVGELTEKERRYILGNKGGLNVISAVSGMLVQRNDLVDKFDRIPVGHVPFKNGMYVLGHGFRPFRREDLVTAVVDYEYHDTPDPDDMRYLLEEFYPKVFPVPEEREFFLALMGYAMLGDATRKNFVVMTDVRDGYNGKSTVMRLQERTFGDLAARTQNSFLYCPAHAPEANAPNPTNLHYRGKRLAFFEEPDNTKAVNVAWIKQLTGGEVTLAARANFSNAIQHFDFRAFIVIAANEGGLPRIDATDKAFLQRLIVIPMRARFVADAEEADDGTFTYAQDPAVRDRLYKCALANFHIVARAYASTVAMCEPRGFVEAKQRVVCASDPTVEFASTFVDECLDLGGSAGIPGHVVLARFEGWAAANRHLFPDDRLPRKRKLEKSLETVMAARGKRPKEGDGSSCARTYPGVALRI